MRIPRTEPSVRLSMQNQPNMSMDALTGPGRALQGLGSAIAGLGEAFASVRDEDQRFRDQLNLVNWSNEVDLNERQTQQDYRGDGTDYTLEREGYFDNSANDVLSNISPAYQNKARLYVATKRGSYLEGAQRFEGAQVESALTSNIEDSIGLSFSHAASAAPEDFERVFGEQQTGIDMMIRNAPISEARKEALRGKAAEIAETLINEQLANDPDGALKALPRVEQMIDELGADDPRIIPGGRLNGEDVRTEGYGGVLGQDGSPSGRSLLPPSKLGATSIELPQGRGSVASGPVAPMALKDFSAGRTNYRPLPASRVKNIVLHDVSGNAKTRAIPNPENIRSYHIVFDDKGIYQALPLDREAPHARAFNKDSIGIAYRGFEGDKLSPQAIANGAAAVKMVADKFGIPPERILTHPGAGPRATKSGKDPREAAWRTEVLAYLKDGGNTEFAGSSTAAPEGPMPVGERGMTQYAGLGGPRQDRKPNTIPAPQLSQEPQLVREGRAPDNLVRVADASGNFPSLARPTPEPRDIPPSTVRAHLRDRLMRKLPAYRRQFDAAVGAAVKGLEESAAKGYALPPEQFEEISKAVTRSGNPDLRIQFDKAVAGLEVTKTLTQLRPVEVEQIATSARAKLIKDGILTATPDQIGRVEAIEGLVKTMHSELDDNPVGWGSRIGIIPDVAPITPETLSIDVLSQRHDAGRAVADYYQQPPKFFLPEERKTLKAVLDKGGADMVQLLGGMNAAFGADMPYAMRELSKDTPEAATVGWLIGIGGDHQAIADASAGIALRATPDGEKVFKSLMPSQDQAREAASTAGGSAFRTMPGAEQRAIDLANTLYVVRAQRKGLSGKADTWDSELWLQGFNEILGQTTDARTGITYGGLADQGATFGSWRGMPSSYGVKVILPSNVRNDALPEIMDAIRITDLVEGGMPEDKPRLGLKMTEQEKAAVSRAASTVKQTGTADVETVAPLATRGAPIDNMGRAISIGTLRRANLVSIGDGRYWLALGDPLSDDPQWIGSNDTRDGRYVLDLKKLEPALRERVPSAYKDGGAGFSGLRFSDGTWQRGLDTLTPIAKMNPNYKPGTRESTNVVDRRGEPRPPDPNAGITGTLRQMKASFVKGMRRGEWENMDPKQRQAITSAVMQQLQAGTKEALTGKPKPQRRRGRTPNFQRRKGAR